MRRSSTGRKCTRLAVEEDVRKRQRRESAKRPADTATKMARPASTTIQQPFPPLPLGEGPGVRASCDVDPIEGFVFGWHSPFTESQKEENSILALAVPHPQALLPKRRREKNYVYSAQTSRAKSNSWSGPP